MHLKHAAILTIIFQIISAQQWTIFDLKSRQLDVDPPNPTTPNLQVDPTPPTATPTGPTAPTLSPPTGPTVPTPPPTATPINQIAILQPGGPYTLNPGDLYQIKSSGFGVTYSQGEVSTWKFQANRCRMNATCPCVDIPPSYECISGYLKFRTGVLYDVQRFCGGNKPSNFTSNSGELSIRYRSGGTRLSTGFLCFVSCTGFGQTAKVTPNVQCPGPF